MDVCGSHGVSVDGLEELPRGTILGERVGGGPEAVQPVLALVVGLELAAKVVVAEGGVLEIVLAVAAGLPHVEGDVGDGLVGDEVADDTVHVGDLALVVVLDDGVAELAPGGVGRPEGTEDGGGGGVVVGVVGLDVVCDFGDEAGGVVSGMEVKDGGIQENSRFKPDKVRHSVHLIALAVGLCPQLADLVEELHTLEPFFGGEVDLPGEVVQVANGGREDLLEARAGVGTAGVDDVLGEVWVVLVRGSRGGGVVCLGRHGVCVCVLLCVVAIEVVMTMMGV